ncbi:ATP-dependent Clp protease adapter protein CLPS1, chloroplastic-like [Iris pallida]|uniref:ATP-dependent Clp protease adapter protein CLPS1, chloroplastic-like n=1 Tax=Iris pallida TaxID=29817 RepID=A0AAX6H915_IRIPA|nr:ATP-dependent Clp protease adapter protein CLPS1, chloroplastic-like [Iris pallida]
MALSCRVGATISSPNLSNPTAIPPLSLPRVANVPFIARQERMVAMSATGSRGGLSSLRGAGGSGLLERPTFDQSQFDPLPQAQEGGDIGRLRDKKSLRSGDSYRVLLIDDARHTENLVEKALPQVVPSVTVAEARKLFHESRQNGVAVVIVTVKEHAEFYAQMMIRHGLRSAIEPDSSMA